MPILGSQGSGAKGAPGVPTVGTATVTNSTTVSLTFTAPESKLPITSYTATSSPSISLSTSAIITPYLYVFTTTFTLKLPGVKLVKFISPEELLIEETIFDASKRVLGVGELKLKPFSNGTGIGFKGGSNLDPAAKLL